MGKHKLRIKDFIYMKYIRYIVSLALIFLYTWSYADERPVPLSLGSPVFSHEGTIPSEYTCDGQNIFPPLSINGVSKKARSLTLVAVDKESSTPPYQSIIWFIYNIPPQTKTIAPNQPSQLFVTGPNSKGDHAYQSPCPKDGTHHYYFNLYALDTALPSTVTSLEEASSLMKNHLVGYASLMGTYARK
jgi:Raf kinase inhibitor-like YbhB/YbcL family protein